MKPTFRPLWIDATDALAPEPRALPSRADIVVIGGGIAGISAALHLARSGAAPVVLEAGQVASRASGRNDGQVLLGLGEHYNRVVGQFGAERARMLFRFIEDNHAAMRAEIEAAIPNAEWRTGGGLRFAETEHEADELRESSALLTAEGVEHRLWSAADVEARLPVRMFHGALELPAEAIVQPVAMVRGLARAARSAGASIHERRAVRAVTRDGDGYRVALADGAEIAAQVVLHCTSTLARELDDSGYLARHVFPFRGQVLASAPLEDALLAPFGDRAMSSHFCYEYFRVHGRRFVIGGMRWSVPGEEVGVLDDDTANPAVTANLLRYVKRHFPTLHGVTFDAVWTGIMAGTPDALPLVGALPGRPGTFVLLAFNGYGLSFAFLGGKLVAEQILAGRAEHPAAGLFAPRRFD